MPPDDPRDHDRALQADQSGPDTTTEPAGRFAPVAEAAGILGITTDAVRGRIKRGNLRSERRGGTVYVWISGDDPTDQPPTDHDTSRPADDQPRDQSELIEVLREQAEYLRDQLQQERDANRENRRIIAGLTQRIPQLEAPSPGNPASTEEPREAQSVGDDARRGNVPEAAADEQRAGENSTPRPSLWRRLFGGGS